MSMEAPEAPPYWPQGTSNQTGLNRSHPCSPGDRKRRNPCDHEGRPKDARAHLEDLCALIRLHVPYSSCGDAAVPRPSLDRTGWPARYLRTKTEVKLGAARKGHQ